MLNDERKVFIVDGFLITGSFVPVTTIATTASKAVWNILGEKSVKCKSFKEATQETANVKVIEADNKNSISYFVVET